MDPIISFRDFTFQYRAQARPTLYSIDLDIYPGEKILIAGPSGSGKSTLASCINGLIPFSYPGESSEHDAQGPVFRCEPSGVLFPEQLPEPRFLRSVRLPAEILPGQFFKCLSVSVLEHCIPDL